MTAAGSVGFVAIESNVTIPFGAVVVIFVAVGVVGLVYLEDFRNILGATGFVFKLVMEWDSDLDNVTSEDVVTAVVVAVVVVANTGMIRLDFFGRICCDGC